MIDWPTPPSGNLEEVRYHQRLLIAIKKLVPKAGPGMLISERADGMYIELNGLNSPNGSGTKVYFYQITSLVSDDYFMAAALNGSGNIVGAPVPVAKSITGQMPDSEIDDTYTIEYTYTDDNNRTASAALIGSEVQVCHPRYKVGDLVAVVVTSSPVLSVPSPGTGPVPIVQGTGSTISLYEISPARFWCAGADDFTPPAS